MPTRRISWGRQTGVNAQSREHWTADNFQTKTTVKSALKPVILKNRICNRPSALSEGGSPAQAWECPCTAGTLHEPRETQKHEYVTFTPRNSVCRGQNAHTESIPKRADTRSACGGSQWAKCSLPAFPVSAHLGEGPFKAFLKIYCRHRTGLANIYPWCQRGLEFVGVNPRGTKLMNERREAVPTQGHRPGGCFDQHTTVAGLGRPLHGAHTSPPQKSPSTGREPREAQPARRGELGGHRACTRRVLGSTGRTRPGNSSLI